LQLELIVLVSKASFTCKFFSFFQSNQANGGFTVGLLALIWKCRSIDLRVFLEREGKPLSKQMHYEALLIKQTNNPVF